MSVKCEKPIDELTVQVWLLYHHPNFKYCTLFVSGMELRTDGQTDRRTNIQTNDPITRYPRRTFQAGGIKIKQGQNFPCIQYFTPNINCQPIYEPRVYITHTVMLHVLPTCM